MSNFLNNANKNWSVVAGQIQNQDATGVVYIKPSAFQIPVGLSNERPTGEAGMIRYLTSDNIIEYYNANTGSWVPISQQPPEITSIDPQYYPIGSTSLLTINGSNFLAGATVTFIGNDGTIYGPTGSSFITSSQLSCSVPIGVKDNSLNDPFDVKVTNPSGLSSQLDNSLFINENPIFVTSQTPSVYATIDASTILTGQLDISATDPENHYPITFAEISGNNLSPLILETSGVISGTVPFPTPVTATSQSVVFTVEASDNILASSIGSFTYEINRPVNDINVSSFGTLGVDYTRTYLDTIEGSGNTVGSPVIGGSTVYQFKSTGLTGNIAPSSNPFNLNYCVVAGGGAGGCSQGGGGGAGGVKLGNLYLSTSNNVSVGIGGTGNTTINSPGGNGSNSILGSITATGGGGGGGGNRDGFNQSSPGQAGGSGGGGAGMFQSVQGGGTGNQGEGNTGGSGFGAASGPELGGGGGGANIKGGKSISVGNGQVTGATGDGGAGILTTITGSNVYYGGGGGGGARDDNTTTTFGVGGIGGGGNGRVGGSAPAPNDDTYGGNGVNGTPNTGGGGGGGGGDYGTVVIYSGGNGGSGIVIVRFPSYTFSQPTNYLTISSVNNVYYKISYLNTSLSQVDYPDPSGYTVYIFNSANNTTSGTVTATPNNTIDISYVVVGGGGSGGTGQGGGGGAGGVVIGYNASVSSALNLTIGAGGIPADSLYSQPGAKGTDGTDSTITGAFSSTAGGGGAGGGTNSGDVPLSNGNNGNATNGSGGGGGANSDGTTYGLGGTGDGSGGNGGRGNLPGTGYGGGGGGASTNGSNSSGGAGAGGDGIYSSILGYNVGGGGGGGSGGSGTDGASGGLGGGGQGRGTALVAGGALYTDPKVGENGVNGTGGGGGGGAFGTGSASFMGGNGGSGVIGILFRTS